MSDVPEKLIGKHQELVHSDMRTVTSHVQREEKDWILNTLMIAGCNTPFRYRRKKTYRNLKGQRVNLTYYPDQENIGGINFEVMKVVRVKIS